MSDLTKIAVDAMGGDGSPKKIIDGIIHSHKSNKENFFKIFGDKIKIEPLINDRLSQDFYEIIHTNNEVLKNIIGVTKNFFFKYLQSAKK